MLLWVNKWNVCIFLNKIEYMNFIIFVFLNFLYIFFDIFLLVIISDVILINLNIVCIFNLNKILMKNLYVMVNFSRVLNVVYRKNRK